MVSMSWGPNSAAGKAQLDAMNAEFNRRLRAGFDAMFEAAKSDGLAEAAGWETPAQMARDIFGDMKKEDLKDVMLEISRPYW